MSKKTFPETLLFHWARQFIGSSFSFTLNMGIASTVGIAYSFKLTSSPVLLGLFGLLNPAFLTICVYRFMGELPEGFSIGGISLSAFSGAKKGLMLFGDLTIIVALATLIFFGVLNYFLFRFLLLFILPIMLLVGLHFLYSIYVIDQQNKS
ncbi:MAG TPA: hypothetical protein VMW01_10255 [Williamwhitmania sp.]|nr:hypothetical protein [Williamwhitmania sp.]